MFEFKLQLGCLIIIVYFISAYVRETRGGRKECNRFFDALLVFCPAEVIFDGVTAWTVNHLDMVPAWLNLLLHALFFLSINSVIILVYLYMVDRTIGFAKKRYLFLVLAPGIVFTLGILAGLPELQYLSGKRTNYSMGISPIVCFASLVIHFILIFVLVLGNHRTIERVRIFDIIAFIILVLLILLFQIIHPEILTSALLPTISLIVLYMTFENPAFDRLEKYNNEMVTGFATLVESRDDSTGGHIQRTKGYVSIILKELKNKPEYKRILTKDYITHVKNAAPMHDIGKIATPDYILQKPGKLTADEYEIMKQHAAKGGEIIRDTFANLGEPEYQRIAYEVATYHHERWDGLGYPKGLREEEIPLHARIMAVADVFDAVSAKRCYRDAMPLDTCFQIIEEGVGSQFDPKIAKAFIEARDKVEKYYSQNV